MPVLRDWALELDVDQVLRGQGADPAVVRSRSPAVVRAAEQALADGVPFLAPAVAYERWSVRRMRHERLELDGGAELSGRLIAQHLHGAKEIAALVCTIGNDLEALIAEMLAEDPVRGLALDGLGSVAVESLAALASNQFQADAASRGWRTSLPLSPGMVGWPVEQGQPQVFALLDASSIGVHLTPGGMMVPRKSITLVLGFGPGVRAEGRACDFCSLRETCRYQDHYA
ncbi:MAG: hypothetical protein AB1449_11145 [Chloroflexota bacterium]